MQFECDKDSLEESLLEAEQWAAIWMIDYYEKEVLAAGLELKKQLK